MMIGSLAYFKAKSVAPDDACSTEVVPSISMAKRRGINKFAKNAKIVS